MAYVLEAFLGLQKDLQVIADTYNNAQIKALGQSIALIPMTEELYDEINKFTVSEDIDPFTYLTTYMEETILNTISLKTIGYVEAEYFGGIGSQFGILWENGKRYKILNSGYDAINFILEHLGVVAAIGKDEFDTLGFGKRRQTADWLRK